MTLSQTKNIVIIILGAPNDAEGNLSSIALERCQRALIVYKQNPGAKLLPTGGWGAHFNSTDKPHGYYIQQYFTAHDVPATDILACVESANTLEDALFAKPIIEQHGFTELIVVTSDFHIPRVRFLFEHIFPNFNLAFSPAQTDLDIKERQRLREHEAVALQKLRGSFATERD